MGRKHALYVGTHSPEINETSSGAVSVDVLISSIWFWLQQRVRPVEGRTAVVLLTANVFGLDEVDSAAWRGSFWTEKLVCVQVVLVLLVPDVKPKQTWLRIL